MCYLCSAMKDSESNIKVKVVSGYILVALITLGAMWLVYAKIVSIASTNEQNSDKVYEKSALTSSVISHLYQVDYYGNRLTLSYSANSLKQYRQALDSLYINIDSLKTRVSSQHQSELIERLQTLLKKKNRNTLELAKIRLDATQNDYYERSIEDVIQQSALDTVDNIVIKSTLINDTIKSPEIVKRKFFQRVGDVFSPKKSQESTPRIVTSVKRDTIINRHSASDSVAVALKRAKDNISSSRLQISQNVSSKSQELIATEQLISAQIGLIITELNREAAQNSLSEIAAKQSALSTSGRVIAIVGAVAIIIIALFLFFILKDISRSARYKRQLEAARLHAEELMESRHRMLLNISHDIKAPLCSITGYLDLMQSSDDQKIKKWSGSMKISASYIMDLLTNLLEFARLERGKSVVHISSFDVDSMVDDVANIFEPIAKDKGISLTINRTQKVGYIASDAMRLRQIVMNLTSNAVKFTDTGGVEIEYRLDEQHNIIFLVRDSGRGIAEAKLNAIFDEFTREQKVEGVEGSGLGLAVVRGAVMLLGGTISVESIEQQGSTFTVAIPVTRAEATDELRVTEVAPMDIMIVDDDPLQLRMLSEMINRSAHRVHCASTLNEAMELLASQRIELVLTDLQMGTLSGHQLLEHIRAKGYVMPVVAVSASEQTNRAQLQQAGFSDFLRKPFSLAALNATIAQSAAQEHIATLEELMGGDREAIKEIMDLFVVATGENIEILKSHLTNDRLDEARKVCHKMLPMFMQLQLSDIATLLKEVDAGNLDAEKIKQIIALSQSVIAQYRTV